MHSDFSLVSVIIPAYNAEVFIGRTLESVISQTYKNLEIIVVDDGSQDGTASIVESFMEIDSRIVLLKQANAGVAAARNLAIAKSSGEFIAPIDADDIWYPEKIEKQVQCLLASHPNVGLVYNWSVLIDEDDVILGQYEPEHYFRFLTAEGNAYPALLYMNIVGNASVPLIRRSCFEKVGGYNCQLKQQNAQGCEDWDIYLRIADFYEYRVVPEFLVAYRQVKGSMSRATKSMAKSFELVITDARQRRLEFPQDIYQQIYNWSASSFFVYLLVNTFEGGDYWNTLVWLYKAIQKDYIILLRRSTYQIITVCALNILAKPIISSIVNVGLRRRHKNKVSEPISAPITINEINQRMQKPQKLVTWKPYEKLSWQRWLRILQHCESTCLLLNSSERQIAYLSSGSLLKKGVNS
ncbi:MAG: glycosyltransferase family 2 protein [Calothrix sp. FI2-JRJ7]|jgi:glycosyltransferase involved in cell wall biosynthesis|nr:glycosyltransferase family 2 protein [Calothrix sp. FI2-JRJ7]